ncbi:MAG: PAS domain S-box protein [Chloroflexi bacterium]|nr:PAS domain S-box protein [Chloroflexota bacterium]
MNPVFHFTSSFKTWLLHSESCQRGQLIDCHHARLLIALLVILVPIGVAASALRPVLGYASVWTGYGALAIPVALVAWLAIFWLARTGRYQHGAILAIVAANLVIVVTALRRPDNLSYLLMPLLFSALLLSVQFTLRLFVVDIALMVALAAFFPEAVVVEVVIRPLTYMVIGSVLVLLANRHRDLIERLRQAALSERERMLQGVVDQLNEGLTLVDERGAVLEWNRELERITGLARAEVVGEPVWEVQQRLTPEVNMRQMEVGLAHFLRRGEQVEGPPVQQHREHNIIRQDGVVRTIEQAAFPVETASGWLVATLFRDVTEHKRAEAQRLELEVEKERMRVLSQFLEGVTHEFSTALSVIQTGVYLMQNAPDADKRAEHAQNVSRQLGYISELLAAMTTMSRLDIGTELHLNALDVNRLLRDVIARFEAQLAEKQISCDLPPDEPLPSITGDQHRLFQALGNLLANAIQYTPEGGTIRIKTYSMAGSVVIECRDSGIGISPEDLPHIFERFFRGDKARTYRQAGMGLPIARKIIELHGGRIEVKSVPDQGSTFTVFLPVPAAE